MTDGAALKRYADATVRRKGTLASHIGWPLTAIKALEGLGIRNKSDQKRLVPQILKLLEDRGDKPRRTRKEARHAAHC